MNDLPPMICRTCRNALDFRMDAEGAGWQHAMQDSLAGHDPDPMPAPPGWRGRCDFCNVGTPTHVVPARSFTVPGSPGQSSDGDWAGCETCATLIDADNWEGVLAHVALMFRRRHGFSMPGEIRRHIRTLFERVRENVTGPIRPIEDEPEPESGPPGQSGC